MSYEIELKPGEKIALPPDLVARVGAGRWVVTIQPVAKTPLPIRGRDAFLNGYFPEDEGLYDDQGR